MRMPPSSTGFSLRESRLIFERESGFGEHMKDYGHDLADTYVHGKKGLDRVLGAVGLAGNLLFKGGDELYKGAVGQKFNAPHGIAGHTRADIVSLFGNIWHFRPLRAAGDVWSLATGDIPLDALNLLTGNTLGSTRSHTRASLSTVLSSSTHTPVSTRRKERALLDSPYERTSQYTRNGARTAQSA